MKLLHTVVCIIYDKNKDYEFLILKKKGTWTGWQFVQGGIEKGQTEEDAVRTEIKEEAGLTDIKIIKKLKIKTDYWFKESYTKEKGMVHKFCRFFLIKANKKDKIKLSIEHSDAKWVRYETALKEIKYNKKEFEKAYKELKETAKQKTLI